MSQQALQILQQRKAQIRSGQLQPNDEAALKMLDDAEAAGGLEADEMTVLALS